MIKSLSTDNGFTESDDPVEVVEENRELFERLAESDLPVAKYAQRALDRLEDGGGEV